MRRLLPFLVVPLLVFGAPSQTDCLRSRAVDLAALSDCADPAALRRCLVSTDADALELCFVRAGCSSDAAALAARDALRLCDDQEQRLDAPGDLRRRNRAAANAAQVTAAVDMDHLFPGDAHALLAARQATSDDTCMITTTKSTTTCPVSTGADGVSTLSCVPTEVASSYCAPGKTCSLDTSGVYICMDLQNSIGLPGIIVAIVMGSAVVIGVTTIVVLAIRERRAQRRLVAKAEATALARAQTRKQRQREVRQPLMKHQEAGPAANTNITPSAAPRQDPFSDPARRY